MAITIYPCNGGIPSDPTWCSCSGSCS